MNNAQNCSGFSFAEIVEALPLICFQHIAILKTVKFSLFANKNAEAFTLIKTAKDINLPKTAKDIDLLKTAKAMPLICFQYIASLLLMLTNDLGGNISSFKYREKAFLKQGGDSVKVKVIQ